MHYYKGNPSKLPYICIVWFPPIWVPFNNPCYSNLLPGLRPLTSPFSSRYSFTIADNIVSYRLHAHIIEEIQCLFPFTTFPWSTHDCIVGNQIRLKSPMKHFFIKIPCSLRLTMFFTSTNAGIIGDQIWLNAVFWHLMKQQESMPPLTSLFHCTNCCTVSDDIHHF